MDFDRKLKIKIGRIYGNIFSPHFIFLLCSFLNKQKTTNHFFLSFSPILSNQIFPLFLLLLPHTNIYIYIYILSFIIIILYLDGEVIKHNGSHKKGFPEFLKWPQESCFCFCFYATGHKTRTKNFYYKKTSFQDILVHFTSCSLLTLLFFSQSKDHISLTPLYIHTSLFVREVYDISEALSGCSKL